MMEFLSNQYPVISAQKSFLRVAYCLCSCVLLSLFPLKAETDIKTPASSFFQRKAEGWHWYQDTAQCSVFRDQKKKEQKPSAPTPTQAIEAQRKALETKLHAAIVAPTHENLIAYITAQKALMDQSQKFSEMWKQVVMITPSLDETLQHPVDQNAVHIYYAEQRENLAKRIKKLASEYGLFFFFRKNCTYCHHFAPVVKRFSQKYGWSVLAVSLDCQYALKILPLIALKIYPPMRD